MPKTGVGTRSFMYKYTTLHVHYKCTKAYLNILAIPSSNGSVTRVKSPFTRISQNNNVMLIQT